MMDDREYELKRLELALKDREVAAREREVAAKERESGSKWTIPLVVGLISTALALIVNIITTGLNNRASERAEHRRAQSNLVLSVIKTGGNEDDACGNLTFFAKIGLLDDPNLSIQKTCGNKGEGRVPTLPVNASVEQGNTSNGLISPLSQPSFGIATTLDVKVDDATSHEPIANARVDVQAPPLLMTISGTLGANPQVRSTATDANGFTFLNFVSSYDTLTVSKDGYITQTASLAKVGLNTLTTPTVTIDLQRAPAAKKK
jgi:hypothetical protein